MLLGIIFKALVILGISDECRKSYSDRWNNILSNRAFAPQKKLKFKLAKIAERDNEILKACQSSKNVWT